MTAIDSLRRYDPSDFEYLLDAKPEKPRNSLSAVVMTGNGSGNGSGNGNGPLPSGAFVARPGAAPPEHKLTGLLEWDPTFRATWEHRRDLPDQSLSAYDQALANFAARAEWTDQEIADLIVAFRRRHGTNETEISKPWINASYLRLTLTKAREGMMHETTEAPASDALKTEPQPEPEQRALETETTDTRSDQNFDQPARTEKERTPVVYLRAGGLAPAVAESERHLAAATLANAAEGVYQRAGFLVTLARLPEAATAGGVRRAAGTLQILNAGPDVTALKLAKFCAFLKFNQRSKKWTAADVPERVARTLCAAAGEWRNVPHLAGIVEAPALRTDGTLLDKPGYDAASGLYFDPGDTRFPPIPERPSRADAEVALALLLEILKGFPFVDDAARSVAVAAMLTPLVRHAVRSAPLTLFTAPKAGSGKTLLTYLPAYLATGRKPLLISQAANPQEEAKRLLALLMEGSIVSVIDNCERPLKSDALCTILTEPEWSDRVLGVSRNARVSTATSWAATGNNLRVEGDLSRRTLLCKIDPECERPEERSFPVDLHEIVPRRRGELAVAALTVVRARLASGECISLPVYGGFEQWSRLVREPLVWLGMADPCDTRRAVEASDPVREQLAGLLCAWRDTFGGSGVTVAEALNALAELDERNPMAKYDPAALQALNAAVRAVAEEKDNVSNRRLGSYLSRYQGRIESGLRFERAGDRQRYTVWRVCEK